MNYPRKTPYTFLQNNSYSNIACIFSICGTIIFMMYTTTANYIVGFHFGGSRRHRTRHLASMRVNASIKQNARAYHSTGRGRDLGLLTTTTQLENFLFVLPYRTDKLRKFHHRFFCNFTRLCINFVVSLLSCPHIIETTR